MSHSRVFGSMSTGIEIMCYRLVQQLENGRNFEADILTYGATVQRLVVPDRQGRMVDVVLGCSDMKSYENSSSYLGCVVGRVANRIKGGTFTLDGKVYQLAKNNGPNHLHGGLKGMSRKVWQVASCSSNHVTMDCVSEADEDNYPGTLTARVTYTLKAAKNVCTFAIDLTAVTSATTLCNPTCHIYLNLSGAIYNNYSKEPNKKSVVISDISDHQVQFLADRFMPVDSDHLAKGEIRSVFNTVYDFTRPQNLGEKFEHLLGLQEYTLDNYFILKPSYDNDNEEELPLAATIFSRSSGIRVKIFTNQPGFQFYAGDYLKDRLSELSSDEIYGPRSGFALETHGYPDAVNHSDFPSIVLTSGSVYQQKTSYIFDTVCDS